MQVTEQAALKPRQRRKQTRPQELLDAALDLFVDKGFTATRAEEVARRAGVSKGTLYLYYPSKEELFKAVVRQNLAHLIHQGFERLAAHEGPTSELLATLLNGWWERVGGTKAGGIHKVVMAEVRNFPDLAQFYASEVIVPAERLFEATLQRGIERGEFRALPTREVSHALMAPLIFLLIHEHSLGCCPVSNLQVDAAATLRAHIDLVLKGLEVRPVVTEKAR